MPSGEVDEPDWAPPNAKKIKRSYKKRDKGKRSPMRRRSANPEKPRADFPTKRVSATEMRNNLVTGGDGSATCGVREKKKERKGGTPGVGRRL